MKRRGCRVGIVRRVMFNVGVVTAFVGFLLMASVNLEMDNWATQEMVGLAIAATGAIIVYVCNDPILALSHILTLLIFICARLHRLGLRTRVTRKCRKILASSSTYSSVYSRCVLTFEHILFVDPIYQEEI